MITRSKTSNDASLHLNVQEKEKCRARSSFNSKRKHSIPDIVSEAQYSNKKVAVGQRKPPKFSFVVDDLLAGQGRPTLPGHVQFLCDYNIEYIVTLTLNKPRALIDLPDQLQWVHIPIQDETAPSVDQIREFVALVDKAKSEKKRVSVHCAWGRGRTGTMLACYLAKQLELSASDAIAKIRSLRPGSVDTEKQEKAIDSYVEFLHSSKKQCTD